MAAQAAATCFAVASPVRGVATVECGSSRLQKTVASSGFRSSTRISYDGLGKCFKTRLATPTPAFTVRKAVKASSAKITHATAEAPLVGSKAPDFEADAVFDQEFVKVKLSSYQEQKKYVVLFFYPLDFTFVCPTEITAFSDKHEEFEKLNTEILGVSVDSQFSHLAWIQTDRKSGGLGDLKYPLVADLTKEISKKYQVLLPAEGIALRGLFIIDREGIIQHATINNLGIGRSVEETLRTLQAVQYIQNNPDEVCPAGWKPGEKTMKPDTKLSKEYFAAI
eukprot:TRINITY_DN22945_c0_g1_i1.p1 TRINITY_DN22945_c0_g1~~TRINITY_DN22945_c0_g1_i1.p1  ORF type:complete len:293 (-),score=71.92 TRINITY_DN22945_c0_g1_i1:474-1313(-)